MIRGGGAPIPARESSFKLSAESNKFTNCSPPTPASDSSNNLVGVVLPLRPITEVEKAGFAGGKKDISFMGIFDTVKIRLDNVLEGGGEGEGAVEEDDREWRRGGERTSSGSRPRERDEDE